MSPMTREEQDRLYGEHAKEIDRMGLKMTRCRDLGAEYEYHACVDGVLLCDYVGHYSIRIILGDLPVSNCVECPTCAAAALAHEQANTVPPVARETTSVWVDGDGVPRPDVRVDGMVSLWNPEDSTFGIKPVNVLDSRVDNDDIAAKILFHSDARKSVEGVQGWTNRAVAILQAHAKACSLIPERLVEEKRKADVWWEALDEHDQELFVTEFIDTLCDLLLDPGEGRTREELRDSMETYLDAQYDAEDRHMAPLPRQAQLNKIIDVLLANEGKEPVIYVRDGLICQHINEVEEQAIQKALLEELK